MNDDERAVRSACRDVLSKHSVSARVRAISDSPDGFDEELWKSTAALGWPALAVSEIHDGLGLSTCELALVIEEFGRVVQPSPLAQQFAVCRTIERHGSSELCASLLPQLADGTLKASWATAPGGSTQGLTVDPDGATLRLSGSARWVPEAHVADRLLLAADLAGTVVLVLVDTRSPGISVDPQQTMDLTRRHSSVSVDTVITPEQLITAEAAAGDLFELGVLLQCAEAVGIASSLLEMTVAYAKHRHQFGVPIGSFQALKHRMADMLIEVEAARACTWDAAELWDGSSDPRGIREAISVAKTVAAPAASSVASSALQILGGIGFTWEHDLHFYLRRAKVNEMTLGTVSWHLDRLVDLLS